MSLPAQLSSHDVATKYDLATKSSAKSKKSNTAPSYTVVNPYECMECPHCLSASGSPLSLMLAISAAFRLIFSTPKK